MLQIPLAPGSKSPLAGEDWHNRISDDPEQHSLWLAQGYNVGFPLEENGRVVVDFDRNIEAAREHYKTTLCQVIVKTKRGFHFHYSGKTSTRKFPHGDIKGNGYVVFPPSKVKGFVYELLRDGELQPFPEHLFPIEAKEQTRRLEEPNSILRVRRAEEYGTFIFAVSGQNGHNSTFRYACFMRDIGLTEGEALLVITNWNETNAHPKWSPKELNYKIRSAFKLKGATSEREAIQ